MNRFVLTLVVALGAACSQENREFALPPGDTSAGQTTFVELHCNDCHSIKDIVARSANPDPEIYVELGGEVTRIKTYGELVTSIINPTHRLSRGRDPRTVDADGESKMRLYNDTMTVQQLVDLTTFLSAQYSVWSPQYVSHRYF